jgi:hypothetical protein
MPSVSAAIDVEVRRFNRKRHATRMSCHMTEPPTVRGRRAGRQSAGTFRHHMRTDTMRLKRQVRTRES